MKNNPEKLLAFFFWKGVHKTKTCEISGKITRQDAEKVKENLVVVGKGKVEDPFSVCSELSFGPSSQGTVISVQGVCVERGEEKGEANFYFLKKKAFLTSRPKSGEQPQTETTKQKQI